MSRHSDTWDAIYADPVRSSIDWKDIEAMLRHLGADIKPGNGSRVRIQLKGVKAVFHRPHPEKEADKGAVVSMRDFLDRTGVNAP